MPTRYAITFFGIGLACAALAASLHGWAARIALLWVAVAFAALAAAYHFDKPGLFMKRATGRRHALSRLLFWPIDLINLFIFNVYHRLSPEPAYVEILPNLYLGRRLWSAEAAALGPCAVLDLTCELNENRAMRGPRYRCLPVLDNFCPTQAQLRDGVNWLKEALPSERVYIHCAAGHGRSATLLLAYLLATHRVNTIDEGLALLKSRRPRVYLNACQQAAVQTFTAEYHPVAAPSPD